MITLLEDSKFQEWKNIWKLVYHYPKQETIRMLPGEDTGFPKDLSLGACLFIFCFVETPPYAPIFFG